MKLTDIMWKPTQHITKSLKDRRSGNDQDSPSAMLKSSLKEYLENLLKVSLKALKLFS